MSCLFAVIVFYRITSLHCQCYISFYRLHYFIACSSPPVPTPSIFNSLSSNSPVYVPTFTIGFSFPHECSAYLLSLRLSTY